MTSLLLIASWVLAVIFGLAAVSFFLMGLAPRASALLGITLVLLPPVRALRVVGAFGEWMHLLMAGVTPRKAAPVPFTAEQRQNLKMPVLLVLGEKDHLVGNPEIARAKVQDIPDIRVAVLDTGHLIGAEQSEKVNALLTEFFGQG